MKNLFKSDLHTLAAALTLGTLSIGFSPAAMAISTYDAEASLSLTLTDVTGTGGTVTDDWSVKASGSDFGGVDLFEFGDASASGTTSVVNPAVSMSISDSILQSSTASGTATNGFSWTDAMTNLTMSVTNSSDQALTFSFDYNIIATASATGDDATADVLVELWDKNGLVDILAEANADSISGPVFDDASQDGSFEFMLDAGQSINMVGNAGGGVIDSIGSASAVPVPAAVWLFGSGLLGLVGIARRKQAA